MTPTSAIILAIAGPIAVAAGWLAIRRGLGSVWTVMVPVLVAAGIAAVLTGVVRPVRGSVSVAVAVAVGAGSGGALYVATRVFMAVAARWRALREATTSLYGSSERVTMPGAFVLGALVGGPAEELLWRGVVYAALLEVVPPLAWAPWLAASIAWCGYVLANAFSGSLPILLAAAVPGAAWTVLGTSGVAAPIACHVVWTGLMIVLPPSSGDG